jgi:hypothetical protein
MKNQYGRTGFRLLMGALIYGFFPVLGGAQEPALEEMIENVIARDEAQEKTLRGYEYDQTVILEKLADDGSVRGREKVDMTVRPGKKSEFTVVSGEKGGVFIPGGDSATKAMEKQARDSEKTKSAFSLRKIAGRYNISKAGRETVAGRAAHILAFTPRKGQPAKDRIEKILNHLRGRMWVSAGDYSILKTEAVLSQPVEIAWFFATMRTLEFCYAAQPIGEGYGPANFQLQFEIDVPLRTIRQRQDITMRNFRARPGTAGAFPAVQAGDRPAQE